MSPDREWGRFYYCHSCMKNLNEEFFNSHTALGHKTEWYKTMPREVDKRIAPKEEIKSFTIKDEIRKDYADVEEIAEDWEIGQ